MSGPADAAEALDISKLTLDDLRKQPLYSPRSLFFWTKEQTSVLANADTKAILCGDFGTGKSLLLHSLVLSSSQEETRCFIISGLKDEEMQARGVLDISNKLRYEDNKMITVIDARDIADKTLREKTEPSSETWR